MKRLLLVFSFLAFAACASAKTPELKQFYTCKGVDVGGHAYTVDMETRNDKGSIQFRQSINGQVIIVGAGFYDGDRYIAIMYALSDTSQPAIAEYRIKGKMLEARWQPGGDTVTYRETCMESAKPVVEPVAPAPAGHPSQPANTQKV